MRLHQLEDLLHDDRREAGRGLVEQQQLAARTSARGRSRTSAARRRTACRRAGGGAPAGAGTARRRSRAARRNFGRAAGMKAPIAGCPRRSCAGTAGGSPGTWAMPSSTIRCGRRRRQVDALHRDRAARSAGSGRRSTRISVVLPAPFGPITADRLAARAPRATRRTAPGSCRSRRDDVSSSIEHRQARSGARRRGACTAAASVPR